MRSLARLRFAAWVPDTLLRPHGYWKINNRTAQIRSLDKSKWQPTTIGFSARTSANATQAQVDGRLDKRRKGVYGPIPGAKGVFFIDDVNMPSESYGANLLLKFFDNSMITEVGTVETTRL